MNTVCKPTAAEIGVHMLKSLSARVGRRVPLAIACPLWAAGCGSSSDTGSDGPVSTEAPVVHQAGDPVAGKQVFRFETVGNEGFWTDALRLQQGIMATHVTPLDALKLGLMVDSEAIDATTLAEITAEAKTDLSAAHAPLLNDPAATIALINANAVIGIVAKDAANAGTIDITAGSKTGATCAICHTITDASVLALPNGGSIGKRLDGRTNHVLNFGTLVATALNSRAFYPVLQLVLVANGGKTLGRAPTGLTPTSTEAEVDAYLTNPAYYPIGSFDDTVDGNGDPQHNSALLDSTNVTSPGGRAFLQKFGGTAAGAEIADGYVQVLAATGVTGYPYTTRCRRWIAC